MKTEIISKKVEISEPVKDYIEKKIEKLGRYLPNITDAKVEIYEEKTKSSEQRFATKVMLKIKGTLFTAEERGGDIYVTIDRVAESLARQIERYKGKLYERGKRVSLARQGTNPSDASEADESKILPKVVKFKRFLVKPMSITEAAEQMELLGHDFFIFVNADSEDINILYRRKDGNYGLIQPELA